MADFPLTPLPSYPIDWTPATPEVLISTFRDGSEQRRKKGTGKERLFKLKFGGSLPITRAEKDGIENHYVTQDGDLLSFNWTHPETGEVIKVRYEGVTSFSLVAVGYYTGTVELQEVPA